MVREICLSYVLSYFYYYFRFKGIALKYREKDKERKVDLKFKIILILEEEQFLLYNIYIYLWVPRNLKILIKKFWSTSAKRQNRRRNTTTRVLKLSLFPPFVFIRLKSYSFGRHTCNKFSSTSRKIFS